MSRRTLFLVLILAFGLSTAVNAKQPKPKVTVRFVLAGKNYRSFFDAVVMKDIEDRLGSACAAGLSSRFGLFSFGGAGGGDTLTIALGDSTARTLVVSFRIGLSGPNVCRSGDDLVWAYRDGTGGFEELRAPQALETNINACFSGLLQNLDVRTRLVTGAFCRLNLTNRLDPLPGSGCRRCRILPLDKDETLVEDTSRFEVCQELPDPGFIRSLCLPGEVCGRDSLNQIVLRLGQDSDEADLTSPGLRLKTVRVISYDQARPLALAPVNVVNTGVSP